MTYLNTSCIGTILSSELTYGFVPAVILTSCRLADEYGLSPVYVKEFHQVYTENEEHVEFGPLLQNMRVVDARGESQMDEDQWEAASAYSRRIDCVSNPDIVYRADIYVAFAFQKRAR